ncbi:MAG: metal-dependent hydrolase [Ferruginibacter sp.]
MDSLTHIALGACMGEAFAGKKVGKKAMIWGALAQSIPDIDFLAAFWNDTSGNLLAHRGFTHSILFCIAVSFLMAFFAERWHRPHNISFARWIAFFGAVSLGHIFLDAFNNYGVGWFEPFSHQRISFNVVYVADLFFSIVPIIALVMLLVLRSFSKKRKFWWLAGLGFCFLYLSYCVVNKIMINREIKQLLARQEIKYDRYFTTPAPLQSWLWFVLAGTDSGYHVGYRSVFDRTSTITLQYFPRNAQLLDSVKNKEELKRLIRFSQNYYTIEKRKDTLVFNDLRFGQVLGWVYPKEEFAFHYYLQPDIDNTLVVQRGRFAKWDRRTFDLFWKRVIGYEKR